MCSVINHQSEFYFFQDTVPLIDGVSLVKSNETDTPEDIPGITDGRALGGLSGIDRDLLVKFGQLLQSHVVRLDLTTSARGNKDKKGTKYVIAALLTTMGIAGPLGLKALALIAGKALVISKVSEALVGNFLGRSCSINFDFVGCFDYCWNHCIEKDLHK